jgi:hypothetical protein
LDIGPGFVREQVTAWEASGVTMMVVNAQSLEQIEQLGAPV